MNVSMSLAECGAIVASTAETYGIMLGVLLRRAVEVVGVMRPTMEWKFFMYGVLVVLAGLVAGSWFFGPLDSAADVTLYAVVAAGFVGVVTFFIGGSEVGGGF